MELNRWLNDSLGRDKQMKRAETNLRKYMSRLNIHQTMLALWEVQRLQEGVDDKTSPRISGLPRGGLGRNFFDRKPHIVPWIIEQMINIISIYGYEHKPTGRDVNPLQWDNLERFYQLVQAYNNARDGVLLQTNDVFETMSRIGRQQFPWQDGSLGLPIMEMYATLYLGEACNKACRDKHQISANEFLSYGFLLVTHFNSSPYLQLPYDLSALGGEQRILKTVLDRYSSSTHDFYRGCGTLRQNDKLWEYSKSQLRKKPIIRQGHGKYFCPMPKLIQFRSTSGLISETSYNGDAINEVGNNFEKYCYNKLMMAFPKVEVKAEETYGTRKKPKKTPDIRLYEETSLSLIIECKATLLLFEDKFKNINLDNLPKKSNRIVKGILQVWRYVNNSRHRNTPDNNVADDCKGLVLTLEEWIIMDKDRHALLLKKAHEIADSESIPKSARINIIITSIKDFIHILEHSTFDEFISCLETAASPDFNGYILKNVFTEIYKDRAQMRDLLSEEILNQKIWYWKAIRTEHTSKSP